ncbi:MAG TPA: NAD-dependent epimerase/dehydratase family protein [Acidimicrobiales bacterium]|jgi:UDP-glucose 4-epimerase|nr:NAD-dependent epimerase/dehydratase family protein [Acidimicrobiales bacterium]
MRVLVTGGAGFIGRYITERLQGEGHQVAVLDHERHRDPLPGVDTILGDVRDDVIVTEAAAHVDGIIHLAAVLGTQETIGNPRPSAATNILGTLNVFEAAVQYGLPVVYAAVGNAWMRTHGGGAYTITKTCAEDFAKMYNHHRGGRIAVVRPMNAYGPRQSVAAPFGWSKVRKITPAFVCRALCGMPIEVYGDGTQISDMIYVADVARVFTIALAHAAEGRIHEQPLEVGPPESATVNDIAHLVANLAAAHTGHDPVPVAHLPMRPGEVPNATVAADVTTLHKAGIDPEQFLTLDAGMKRTVDWFVEHEGDAWHIPAEARRSGKLLSSRLRAG